MCAFVLLAFLLAPTSVSAKPTALSLAEELALEPPILNAPAANARTTGTNYPPLGVPKLAWEPVANAQKYGVEVSATSYGTTHTPQIALADGEYFWRVRANDGKAWGPYSEIRSFFKDWSDAGNVVVELISPPEGAERIAFTNDDFSWLPIPGAALYKFEISTDPTFSNIVYTEKTLKAQHTPTKRLSNNVYYWRVTPIDNRDHFGLPSAVRAFSFNWHVAPQLLSPEQDQDLAFVPRFAWTAVEAAQKYELQISTQPDFGVTTIYQTANTEYTPEKAFSNDQDYYWRVKAIDGQAVSTPWSQVRSFRAKWNFQTQLLAPAHNTIKQSHPFLSWTPIPGAERYQVRVDESISGSTGSHVVDSVESIRRLLCQTCLSRFFVAAAGFNRWYPCQPHGFQMSRISFDRSLLDEEFYNGTTAAIVKQEESTVYLDADYFWQVRGIDAQDNYTPWSDIHTFRFGAEDVAPNFVYPLSYYTPDVVNLPVHADRTIAWPLFVWDSALRFTWPTQLTPAMAEAPAYYELTVAADMGFQIIQFQIETTGLGAAPTLAHPFTNLQSGNLAYWRVRAYQSTGQQLGVDHVWVTRIDPTLPQLPVAETITPIYPRAGFEAVTAPVLGWLPVNGISNYRVQISRDPAFNTIVDEALPQFVNYVPWQGRRTVMPFGTYWWRVQAEKDGGALGGWSEVRHFNLSADLITGNKNDFVPPPHPSALLSTTATYLPATTHIASSTATVTAPYELSDLHIMLNRVHLRQNYPNGVDNYILVKGINDNYDPREKW